MRSLAISSNKFPVIAITRDEALIWRHGIERESTPERIKPPMEVDHRHRRTGQFHHGHDTEHKYPEYFEAIADLIRESEGVLILGHGKGKASYAELLMDHLETHDPMLLSKVLDVINFDLISRSEAEIKAHARQWFEKNFRKLSTWHERTADRRLT